MEKEALIQVVHFWHRVANEGTLFHRNLIDNMNLKGRTIIDVVGPRQSGKSSILKLLVRKLDGWLYINFEDPFFIQNNQATVLAELIDIYLEYFQPKLEYLFLDEIQNIENWEKAVRRLHEGNRYKIFLTGSSSKLMSRELSTLITGRHYSYELMPLNFKEFLLFKGLKINSFKEFALQKTKINRYFDRYLKLGGFPKIVLENNEELLKQYYLDILERDIIKRYDIRQKDILEKLGVFLLSHSAKMSSLTALGKTFAVSFEMIANYMDYFREAFLLFELPQFSFSLKTQQKALKKVYASDTGLANAVSFRFSEDKGRMLETCIFLHLRQQPAKIYYYKTRGGLEVDFLVKRGGKSELIQVCHDFIERETKQREIKALIEAMTELRLSTGQIVTKTVKDTIRIGKNTIHVLPASERLLDFAG